MLSRTVLLVTSFSALTYLVGCTALGYVIGDAIDQHHAKSVAVDLAADSCTCEKGDRVTLVLVSGDSLTGIVRQIYPGKLLTLITRFPEPITYKPEQVEEIPWADIRSLVIMQKPATWQAILTPVGALVDFSVYMIIRALSAAFAAISSTGA